MKSYVLDANVCLRYLAADDPLQSPRARDLFEAAAKGVLSLRLSHLTIAELLWVLESFFKLSRERAGARVKLLVMLAGVEVHEMSMLLDALDRFSRTGLDFPDCYAAALSAADGCPVVTYDRDFRKFSGVSALTPEAILKAEP